MVQLGGSGRGVAWLPNGGVTEYLGKELLTAKRVSENGRGGRLYAAVRREQLEDPFMQEFLSTAISTCFNHLAGIKRIEAL